MMSACGRYVLTYNGEIYSAPELRPELEALGRRFRGHSDTEVMVEGIAAWGVRATVERLIGMFAFAVWDRKERRLSLARDRLGIKPLYWGRQNGRVVFASELKAFEALPDWRAEIDHDALASYLRFAYVPTPHSIYRGIDKLAPGTGSASRPTARPICGPIGASWTSPRGAGRRRSILARAKRRMRWNRCLAMRCSGGWSRTCRSARFSPAASTSSTVAAMMHARSNAPVSTFSIGFPEKGYDEAPHAKAVAEHLGTEHTELYVSPEQVEA